MDLNYSEQLNIILKRKGISKKDLAGKVGESQQNLSQKLKRANLSMNDMNKYAAAISCHVEIKIIEND